MNKRILLVISIVVLFLVSCSKEDIENVEKQIPVKIYKVKTESISQYIHATGSISGDEDVMLYSKIAERVERINISPGQSVLKDQILIEQKNEILKQGMEMASAALKSAEAQAKLSFVEFNRMNKLFSEKAVSQQQYDQAKTVHETAEHAFEQAKSMLEQAKEQLENSFIKAPFNGIIAAVYVEKNQTVNIGQPVAQIISHSNMKSKIYLTGEDIQKVKVGQPVAIKIPTIPGEEFPGKLEKINTAIDQISKSLEVEIVLLSKDNRIKSGMFAEFLIETEKITEGLIIPEPALISQTEIKINKETGLQNTFRKFYLYTIKNNKAKLNEVKTGIANNGQIEIKEGLSIGDSVVIIGQNIVKENQTVKVIE